MRKQSYARYIASAITVWVMLAAPLAVLAQTEVKMPKNKYKVEDDVKLGNEYAQKVEREFPILGQRDSTHQQQYS